MRRFETVLWFGSFLGLALTLVACQGPAASSGCPVSPRVVTWEYKVHELTTEKSSADVEAVLNKYGAQGWQGEIVIGPGGIGSFILFKRPIETSHKQ